MTKLQIISRLWSIIYDLIFLAKGTPTKSLEEIETLTSSNMHAGSTQISTMMK